MAKHGRNYREAFEKVDREKKYTPLEAVTLAKEIAYAKFDETVELHVRLGVDPRHADQIVRDLVNLPHGLGKTVKVLVFAQGEDATLAREAGADYIADGDELINKIEGGWFDFDIAIATPNMMGKVGKLGRVLGPQGKMPSPKNGSVTADVATAVAEFAAGKVEFKNDAGGNVHVVVGKQSFEADKLVGNIEALLSHIRKIRPASVKGTYIKRMCISATMSPSVVVSI